MTVRGLMGLAIAAARPSQAERQTARARGAALAADPVFAAALQAVARRRPRDRRAFGHLLPLVARTRLRRARPPPARRLRLVRRGGAGPPRQPAGRRQLARRPLGIAARTPASPCCSSARPTSPSSSTACSSFPAGAAPDRPRSRLAEPDPGAEQAPHGDDDVRVVVTGARRREVPRDRRRVRGQAARRLVPARRRPAAPPAPPC